MATHKSAIKKHRQSLDRRLRNRQHRSRLRGRIKAFRKAIEAGDVDTARGMLPSTLSLFDGLHDLKSTLPPYTAYGHFIHV